MLLNVDYWALRTKLLESSILHDGEKTINIFQYFKKLGSLSLFLKQLLPNINIYNRLLTNTEIVDEYKTVLSKNYNDIESITAEIVDVNKKIKEIEKKYNETTDRFDEIRYFDTLDVEYKKRKTLNDKINIVYDQIVKYNKLISKTIAQSCTNYIYETCLKESKQVVRDLTHTIHFKYSQSNWIFYPFVSRFAKYVWFRNLHIKLM